jgi:hypothetical protein
MTRSLILTDLPETFCGLVSCDLLNRENAPWRQDGAVSLFLITDGGGEQLGAAPHSWPSVSARSDNSVLCAGGIIIVTRKIKVREERPAPAPICAPQTQYRLPCV